MPFDYIDNSLVDGKKMNYQQAPENEGSKFTYLDEPDVATVRENIEPGIMGETEPPEQKLLNNMNALGTGSMLAEGGIGLAGLAGKGLGMVGKATGLIPKLAETAQSQALKAMGSSPLNAAELMQKEGIEGGINKALQLGQKGINEGFVRPFQSDTASAIKLEKATDAASKGIGQARFAGDVRGGMPEIEDIEGTARRELSNKYGSGLRTGESPQLENALTELRKSQPITPVSTGEEVGRTVKTAEDYEPLRLKQETDVVPEYDIGQDPSFTDIANKSTEMNKFANSPRALTQSQEATTDVANIVSRMNNAGLQKVLTPGEFAKYQKDLSDFSENQMLQKFLIKKAGKELTGGVSLNPFNIVGDTLGGHKAMAVGLNKVANFLSTQAGAKTLPILLNAAKSGPAALSVTDHLLGQFDSEYQNAFH